MNSMTLENIASATGGELYYGENADKTREADGVVLDSRLVRENYVFIATVGEKVDGHSFIKGVFENGALAVICEKLPEESYGPCILVKDSIKALQAVAAFYRSRLSTTIIGITGSVGKTSTKEFIAGVLSKHYRVYKTEGNYNNTIGVPLTILKIRQEDEVAVIEMGINQFGEMRLLTGIARPDIAVITNIGECHLEFLGDRDGVLKAKSEIFEGLNKCGHIILNGDDDKLITIKEYEGIIPLFTGIDNSAAAFTATDIISRGLIGSTCAINEKGKGSFTVNIPLPGKHMVQNALTATAVARLLNMNYDEIACGIESMQATGGRSNVIFKNDLTIIDDCYNANPTSTKAAINMLASAGPIGTVAILGDMFELGANEKEYHYEIGRYAAEMKIEKIICIGELSKNTFEGALSFGCQKASFYPTLENAMSELLQLITAGDTVLVKASHGMHFDKIIKLLDQ